MGIETKRASRNSEDLFNFQCNGGLKPQWAAWRSFIQSDFFFFFFSFCSCYWPVLQFEAENSLLTNFALFMIMTFS